MGEVIPLFGREPEPTEPFDVDVLLHEDLARQLAEVGSLLEEVYDSESERALLDKFSEIKEIVSHWPGGGSG